MEEVIDFDNIYRRKIFARRCWIRLRI